MESLCKIANFGEKLFFQFLRNNETLLQSYTYYFHNGSEEIMDSIAQTLRSLLMISSDKSRSLELLVNQFFAPEARSIRESSARNESWLKQL